MEIKISGSNFAILEDGVVRISEPLGASYNGIGAATGVVKVLLPVSARDVATFIKFTLTVQNNATDGLRIYEVGGLKDASNLWSNTTAIFLDDVSSGHTVRFGDDGTTSVVTVGDTGTAWDNVTATVSNVQATTESVGDWATGFSLIIENSYPSTVDVVHSDVVAGGDTIITGDLIVQNSNDRPKISLKDSSGTARTELYIGDTAAGDSDEDATYLDTFGESLQVLGNLGVTGTLAVTGNISGPNSILMSADTSEVVRVTRTGANAASAEISTSAGYGSILLTDAAGTGQKIKAFGSEMRFDNGATTLMTLNTTDLSVVGDVKASGAFTRSIPNGGYLEGTHTSLGTTASQTNPIYIIGSAYQPFSTTLSNMYGVGFSHTNASFINFTGASGWGQYVASDGDARIWLGAGNGVISSTGQHYVGANVVWNAGNDGAGSGLDADLLDGVQGSSYLQSGGGSYMINTPTSAAFGGGYALQIYQPTAGTAAQMVFHVNNDFAGYFGLDGAINDFAIGGWSYGASAKYKVWHAGNDGSGSGLDADLLDGLQLHTGTNNEANKVVRTQANGYIHAGWINSVSGDHAGTITRITASNDPYLRYVTPAHFRAQVIEGNYLSSSSAATQNHYIRNGSPTMYFRDTNHRSAMLHVNSNKVYFLSGSGNDSNVWSAMSNGRWPMYLSTTTGTATFGGNVTANSDIRLKENIRPIGNSMAMFDQIEAKRFDWKKGEKVGDLGFIAQDVRAAGLDEVVVENEEMDLDTKEITGTTLTLDYSRMVSVLWDVVKELKTEIEDLKIQIGE